MKIGKRIDVDIRPDYYRMVYDSVENIVFRTTRIPIFNKLYIQLDSYIWEEMYHSFPYLEYENRQ